MWEGGIHDAFQQMAAGLRKGSMAPARQTKKDDF
jgi:hypothetical protein